MKVYIAGAISNNPDYMKQFAAAEERLKDAGHEVYNPAKNQGYTYKDYIDIGLYELSHCDGIYLLKGYEKSAGAKLEHLYAKTTGMLIQEEEPMTCERTANILNSLEKVRLELPTVIAAFNKVTESLKTTTDNAMEEVKQWNLQAK